ncbi:Flagellar basal-body rod protein FlgC [Sporomusa silvacetica DSM 10669]|uniref:Flagellar basal-body rod protein FlgC n=1 Tax=Sporomusa silvacetica DSM 10669 TaxID=1123289 RepID=A0ABZ3IL99_9FIRM|nr:flagellar basal body rod protein FlgC [Sporomusa silvacetica]OZC13541.1 flagellar basal-body rod protein FlgC [Sporomusa silvacetica DSM 10669]
MGLFQAIDASASGMTAERLRMDVISNNIANANTTRTAEGGPYRRQMVVFEPRSEQASFGQMLSQQMDTGDGVRVTGITKDTTPFKLMYDPNHPDANKEGYVEMPNISIVSEMVDMITASRAYEANVTAANAAKSMAMKALDIGK